MLPDRSPVPLRDHAGSRGTYGASNPAEAGSHTPGSLRHHAAPRLVLHPDEDDLDEDFDEEDEDDLDEDEDEEQESAWGDEEPDEPDWQVNPDRPARRVH